MRRLRGACLEVARHGRLRANESTRLKHLESTSQHHIPSTAHDQSTPAKCTQRTCPFTTADAGHHEATARFGVAFSIKAHNSST